MAFNLVQWFKQLQVRSKILLGVGSLVFLGFLLIMALYSGLMVSGTALQRVANEEEPISAAAYEMEISVVKSGLKVMNYLRTGDDSYRQGAINDKEEFDYYLNQYHSMANNEEESAFALQVGFLHERYWEQGDRLMVGRADQESSFSVSLHQIALTDKSIDQSLASINSRRSGANARRHFLQQMQTSLAKMGKDLGAYLRLGRIASSHEISDEAEQFLVQMNYYQALSLTKHEKIQTQELSRLFDSTHDTIKNVILLHENAEDTLASFFDTRRQLGELLAEKMLPLVKKDMESAKVYAEDTVSKVKTGAALVGPAILLFSLMVVYVLTSSVTQPAEALVAGAAAIGSGQLQYRIPDLGADELGQIGRQFNKMAAQLDQTTVSRDSLENSEAALRVSEQRYARAVSGTNDGLFDWNRQTDLVYYSSRWTSMLGYAEHEFTADPEAYLRLVHPDDIEHLRHNIKVYMRRPNQYLVNEHRVLHKDGDYRWVLFRAVASDPDELGRPRSFAGSQSDIHAQKMAELQLVHDAMHDRLTGLPNRHLLLDRLQHFLDSTKRRKSETCALLFLDLDSFKTVNDTLGHAAGDRLLISLGERLKAILNSTDTLARFGGDEFVILIEDVESDDELEEFAQHLQDALAEPFETGAGQSFVGASVGIVLSAPNYMRAEDMLRDADIAMYRAKVNGKNRHVIFDDTMHGHVLKRAQLESDLRLAMEREEFVIFYQPIIDLQQSRKLVGFEALLRWNHPVRGMMEPDDFIPLLEESGLIVSVGKWLLKTASSTVKAWHRKNYTPWVSVNVSAVQLRESGLVAAVNDALEYSGLSPQYLTLEITETNVMQNELLARTLLNEVKKLGVKLSIDDFGVGYSSLSYLKQFPWDYVKIDRSFVQDISNNNEDLAIIEAIISMVHTLNFDVVAEGIENNEQLEILHDYGIDCVQGYLLARPAAGEHWDGLTSISSKKFLQQVFKPKSKASAKSRSKSRA